MDSKLIRNDLIYPDLSYKIIGCAFEVFNALGPGHSEKIYQKALAESFKEKIIARGYLDFQVEERIIVELKKDERFSKIHIEQVLQYLKNSSLQLAIIINFTKTGVISKRVINIAA